jgi:hypothetical protein
MNNEFENVVINTLALVTIITVMVLSHRRRKLSTSAFGTAFFAYDKLLRNCAKINYRNWPCAHSVFSAMIRSCTMLTL